jgi:hypothetical protein
MCKPKTSIKPAQLDLVVSGFEKPFTALELANEFWGTKYSVEEIPGSLLECWSSIQSQLLVRVRHRVLELKDCLYTPKTVTFKCLS